MAEQYFRKLPDFEYISRNQDENNIGDFIKVKNLFKRAKIREDIAENISFFTKYNIIGDERPDNVAYKFYKDSTLDWLILLSNNIINVQTEWPLSQDDFDSIMLEKYKTYENLYSGIHHFEANEVTNSLSQIIIPQGTILPQYRRDYRVYDLDGNLNPNHGNYVDYFIEFYDPGLEQDVLKTGFVSPVTNYQYEEEKENKKRSIFILKPSYVSTILNDLDDIMTYKKGSEQYLSRTLKRGDDIRLLN